MPIKWTAPVGFGLRGRPDPQESNARQMGDPVGFGLRGGPDPQESNAHQMGGLGSSRSPTLGRGCPPRKILSLTARGIWVPQN
jgi:hypothetical protein